jgi:hypothetical protein
MRLASAPADVLSGDLPEAAPEHDLLKAYNIDGMSLSDAVLAHYHESEPLRYREDRA